MFVDHKDREREIREVKDDYGVVYEAERYELIGTGTYKVVVFELWQRTDSAWSHTTMSRRVSLSWWGRVGTELLPSGITRMKPGSPERIQAVEAHHKWICDFAHKMICKAYPEAEGGDRIGATISLYP